MQSAGRSLREAVLAEIPAFLASGNPEVLPAMDRHGAQHVQEVHRLFAGGEAGDFEFVRAHAHQRAEQRFPLEAMLHAYRCGHRIVSHWVRDAAVATSPKNLDRVVSGVADFAIEYTNTISTIATSEYVAHTRMLAEAEGDLRKELLSTLLSGYDESDGRVARLLKRSGYLEQRQSYCVVAAQSENFVFEFFDFLGDDPGFVLLEGPVNNHDTNEGKEKDEKDLAHLEIAGRVCGHGD